jgi:general secretion pathway protein A
MYKKHFGLKELPFSLAPDPRFLYMCNQYREALAHLTYGMNSNGGFILLTGEVGTGKSTVCRCILEQIPENFNIALVLNPKLTVKELLAMFCDELCIEYPKDNASIKVFIDLINAYLLDAHAKGRKTVLIIEEAQNLSIDVLEQVRLLTNLETSRQKLLQIILLGQPELKHKLSLPELRQLSQRITAHYHLGPLSKQEVSAYVQHRLKIAGARSKLFLPSSIGKLFRLSRGIPRVINMICDRALLGAYAQGRDQVDRSTLSRAAREIFRNTKAQAKLKESLMKIGKAIGTELLIPRGKKSLLKTSMKKAVGRPLSRSDNRLIIGQGIVVKKTEEVRYAAQTENKDDVVGSNNMRHTRGERRKYKRLMVKGTQKKVPYSSNSKIVNISVGGVAIETAKKLGINREYNFTLSYKGNPLRLKGRVVWVMPLGVQDRISGNIIPSYKAGMEFLGKA